MTTRSLEPRSPTPDTQDPKSTFFADSNPMSGVVPSESAAPPRRVQYIVVPARTPRYIDVHARYAMYHSQNTCDAGVVAEACPANTPSTSPTPQHDAGHPGRAPRATPLPERHDPGRGPEAARLLRQVQLRVDLVLGRPPVQRRQRADPDLDVRVALLAGTFGDVVCELEDHVRPPLHPLVLPGRDELPGIERSVQAASTAP